MKNQDVPVENQIFHQPVFHLIFVFIILNFVFVVFPRIMLLFFPVNVTILIIKIPHKFQIKVLVPSFVEAPLTLATICTIIFNGVKLGNRRGVSTGSSGIFYNIKKTAENVKLI